MTFSPPKQPPGSIENENPGGYLTASFQLTVDSGKWTVAVSPSGMNNYKSDEHGSPKNRRLKGIAVNFLSLRGAQRRGNPPVRSTMCRNAPCAVGAVALFGDNRSLLPFIRGIATSHGFLAMTALFQPAKHQFIEPLPRFTFCS